MNPPFLERLARGPILCDGAMGTMLYSRGIPFDRCFDELNLSDPDLVRSIHLGYIEAGAEIIETNTFGANHYKLSAHGFEGLVREINLAGVQVARAARDQVGRPVFIAGSVGPLGRPMAPFGVIAPQEAHAAFREQIEALWEGGVDVIILETIADLNEMRQAVMAAREACDLPVIAQMTFTDEGTTMWGMAPAEMVAALEELGVDVIGANCSVGSQPMLEVVEQMAAVSHTPLSAQPNAGFPARVEGRFIYLSSPNYMAGYARRMVEAGAVLVGGCCGTTPEHIGAMARALQGLSAPARRKPSVSVTVAPVEKPAPRPVAAPPPTTLAQKLGHKFVVSVEVNPPRGLDTAKTLEGVRHLKDGGVDVVNVADSPMARLRMSALPLCSIVQNQFGMETILHFTTRDRNMMRLQADLLGAYALGVRNILALMGDPPRIGDYPNATAVFDVTATGLVKLIKRFNQGVDLAGQPIGAPTSFLVGAALDMGAENLDKEIRVMEKKVQAGADFFMTQPIYDIEVLENFLQRIGGQFPRPTLVGILPLRNYRHAEFLHHEVPGINIPDTVRERMRQAEEEGRATEEGIRYAQELLLAVRERAAGVYLMPSFGRYAEALQVIVVLQDSGPTSQVPSLRSQVSGPRSQVSGPRSQVPGLRSQVSSLGPRSQ